MKMLSDTQFRQDLVKLAFLTVAIIAIAAIFAVNPALSTPTFVSVVFSMLLSPWVAALERRGVSRVLSITIIFGGIALVFGVLGFWAASFQEEWLGFKEKAPEHFQSAIQSLRKIEENLKTKYSFLSGIHPTDSLLTWGQSTGSWFAENGASMVASILTWILLVPPLTFVLLNEGRAIRQLFFSLVPNRFFESFFLVSTEITTAISDYLRAKLVEALLVGLMTTVGLVLVGSPFALVLGIAAGITNIIPYVGPLMGAAPALLISLFDTSGQAKLFPVLMVYLIANVIDTIVIFPLVVAKLVNLHPLLLIAVVAIGQQYYGLVGMLISIPIATACKVIIGEVYSAIYETRSSRRASLDPLDPSAIDGSDASLEESA